MHRLEEKKAANAPTLDDNMAAVEKTLNMFNEAYEKEEKKKKPIVFILSAALIVSSAVAGVGLHLANRNNSNDVPLPPGHSDDLDSTATPADTTTPTPTVSVKPSDNAGDDKIDSTPVPDESEKVEDIYIPGVVVTPRPEQSADPSQSINSDHIHTYGDWGYHDDKMEARMCTICGALEYRSHVIEEFITYDQSQKKDIHKIYTNYECINCGYKYTLSKEGYCEWKLERYDENLEYLKCRKCKDIKEQNHEFNVFEENGNLVYDCTHAECDYVKIESKGPDISFPVDPSPSDSVNPSQPVDPSPSDSVNPSPSPSEDPDRGEIDDGSGNPGIGNGGTKPGFDDEKPSESIPPSSEPSESIPPSSEPSESIPPSSEPTEDPDRGEINDGNGNQGIGNGNVKPFDDEEASKDADRDGIVGDKGHNPGIGSGSVKPFDDELDATLESESKADALSCKINMFKQVKSFLLSTKRTEKSAKIMKL